MARIGKETPQRKGLIALGRQLRHCPSVVTLGIKPNLEDYSQKERGLILGAAKIYFPTLLYVDAMDALGKDLFPSAHCYRYLGDKIKQTLLFQILRLPMPHTRMYYGPGQQRDILKDFRFPFVGKIPRGSSRGEGVFLIRNQVQLAEYAKRSRVAYIQQYIPIHRDLRVVILGKRCVHAYWKEAAPGDFRTNVARGGRIELGRIPGEAVAMATEVASLCGFDHVGFDLCEDGGRFLILEANMVFGNEGFKAAGMDYKGILKDMLERGEI